MVNAWRTGRTSTSRSKSVPFKASSTDIFPEEPAVSAGTSTSSACATGEVGSSPSDYPRKTSAVASIRFGGFMLVDLDRDTVLLELRCISAL